MLHQQFHLEQRIGRALYGQIYLAQDTYQNNEMVAIKQVSLRHAKQALSMNKYMDNPFDERRIAKYLMECAPHENILTYHQDFLENGSWYVVMDYCEGGDLLGRLQASPQSQFEESIALDYFRQIAHGVQYLHQVGIAHRDISLENILLKNNICKLCDFGLSTEANRTCKDRVGKAYYMAPEVVAGDEYDPMAADMWSLGICLFILLTGSPLIPVACRTEKAFLAFESFGVQWILEMWGMSSTISPAVMHLLSGLLQVNPAKRFTLDNVLEYQIMS